MEEENADRSKQTLNVQHPTLNEDRSKRRPPHRSRGVGGSANTNFYLLTPIFFPRPVYGAIRSQSVSV
jgi:hypothetical protein